MGRATSKKWEVSDPKKWKKWLEKIRRTEPKKLERLIWKVRMTDSENGKVNSEHGWSASKQENTKSKHNRYFSKQDGQIDTSQLP